MDLRSPAHYEIFETIGCGSTSTVHRGIYDGVECAVKVVKIPPHSRNDNGVMRLGKMTREAPFLWSLRHPNIVTLHEAVLSLSDRILLFMELVRGGELFDLISRKGRLPEPDAASVFCQVAGALRYIHSRGLIHRDVKAENILVLDAVTQHRIGVKLCDFGHSRLIDDGYDIPLTRVGTPDYWAPEVADPAVCMSGYNETVDIWSLGVLLFVMIEANYPFTGEFGNGQLTSESCVLTHVADLTAKGVASSLPADLIERLLQWSPSKRIPLDECLKHPFLQEHGLVDENALAGFACEQHHLEGEVFVLQPALHECLQSSKDNRTALLADLSTFSASFRCSALLVKNTVRLTWDSQSAFALNGIRARGELHDILRDHAPIAALLACRSAYEAPAIDQHTANDEIMRAIIAEDVDVLREVIARCADRARPDVVDEARRARDRLRRRARKRALRMQRSNVEEEASRPTPDELEVQERGRVEAQPAVTAAVGVVDSQPQLYADICLRPGQSTCSRGDDDSTCVVCMSASKTHVFVPCGHLCVCESCGVEVMSSSKLCPLCRQGCTQHMRVYA
eukprot:TRINITY_DN26436_c0_g1_i1.p1 TRINITY_DN26436_c0_g1~~TRINITY_DN26436_c0_g1_i1.p1  ORF type:complete len:567 (-),score=57.48 TRINITY_DN26436_c0_g1_i1:30-1730(-)